MNLFQCEHLQLKVSQKVIRTFTATVGMLTCRCKKYVNPKNCITFSNQKVRQNRMNRIYFSMPPPF
jgi:hypothetical protein